MKINFIGHDLHFHKLKVGSGLWRQHGAARIMVCDWHLRTGSWKNLAFTSLHVVVRSADSSAGVHLLAKNFLSAMCSGNNTRTCHGAKNPRQDAKFATWTSKIFSRGLYQVRRRRQPRVVLLKPIGGGKKTTGEQVPMCSTDSTVLCMIGTTGQVFL